MLAIAPGHIPPPAATDEPPALHHRADPRDPLALARSWWLFAAHGMHVKRVAAALATADVPHVLPLSRAERVKANRTRYVVDEPVLGSYLFVAGDDEFARYEAMGAVPGKLHLGIPIVDVAGLMADLSQLLDALESGAVLGKARPAPERGRRYRVTGGPFEDAVGILERTEKGGHVLLLHVRCLGQVVPLAVDAHLCEPAED